MKPLAGKVAVVAGATRGAGRGIACALGEAGATVYCTGRSVRGKPSPMKRPETIEETAEMVNDRGGMGIHLRVDHTVEAEVAQLFDRVRQEQDGRLDILVNDVWGGDPLTEWDKKFWELDLSRGLQMLEQAVHSHIITARHGVPLMVNRKQGLVVEVTDGTTEYYRGNLFYDLVKSTVIRLAYDMSMELRSYGVTALAVSPGFLRSEYMLDHFGVTEENWRDAIEQDPHYAESETPFFVGRAVAALAADPDVASKSGGAFSSYRLSREYGFEDVDGRRPDFGAYLDGLIVTALDRAARSKSPNKSGRHTHSTLKKAVRKELARYRLDFLLALVPEGWCEDLLALGPGPTEDQLKDLADRYFSLG